MHLARNGADPNETDQTRVLLVGTRTLYLQALCEVLTVSTGLLASVLPPARLHGSPLDPSPEVVLLDYAAAEGGPEQLIAEIRHTYKGVVVLLLTSSTARESSKHAATLHADGWVSMSLPVGELMEVLSDRAGRASYGRTASSHGPRHAGQAVEWPLSALSERELSVLRLVVDGSSPDEIAATLGISRHTVRTHLQNVMAKMLVRSRTEMVSVARRSGMRPIPGQHQG